MKLLACAATATLAGFSFSFFDNFDTENGGVSALNYTGFANWTVSDGSVDLAANGFSGLSGSGMFVDLDGSTSNAGKMTSISILVTEGVLHTFSFDLSGNQRGGTDDMVNARVSGYVDMNVQKAPFSGWTNHFQTFTPTSTGFVTISFENGGGDNLGALLDNVSLNLVPEPATLVVLGLGLAAMRRRRK
jgi:hypothetical protein